MIDELEKIWKEMIMAEETHEKSQSVSSISARPTYLEYMVNL